MRVRISECVVEAGGLVALVCCASLGIAQPTYDAQRAEAPPLIDGVLSPGEWDAASAAGDYGVLRDPQSAMDAYHNATRILWDDNGIYFAQTTEYGTWLPVFPGDPIFTGADNVDFGRENLNFYFDPNADGEPNIVADARTDNYQLAMNQFDGSSSTSTGNVTMWTGAVVNGPFASASQWDPQGVVIAQENGTGGGVVEVFVPWTAFDFGQSSPIDTGLYHPFAPTPGDTWYIQIGVLTNDVFNFLPVWSWTDSQYFASRQNYGHAEVTWVGGCAADVDGSGAVNTNDFFAFLALYQTQDPAADFTGEGDINTNDFFAFLAAYQGCL